MEAYVYNAQMLESRKRMEHCALVHNTLQLISTPFISTPSISTPSISTPSISTHRPNSPRHRQRCPFHLLTTLVSNVLPPSPILHARHGCHVHAIQILSWQSLSKVLFFQFLQTGRTLRLCSRCRNYNHSRSDAVFRNTINEPNMASFPVPEVLDSRPGNKHFVPRTPYNLRRRS
ncbi:hypothetical protein B0O99DRAFT_647008 [Bisporella sp. PMI_857]|nr:hypothetical protein B0O99DRAFT_647008 [Bisporella sp. PMI_857]